MSQSLWPLSDLVGTVRLDGLPSSAPEVQSRLSRKCSLTVSGSQVSMLISF